MKVVEGFRMRKLCNEYIIVPESVGLVNFNKMISLNESAAYLWESIQDKGEFDEKTLADLLMEKYEVDEALATKDAAAIAQKWLEVGIISR